MLAYEIALPVSLEFLLGIQTEILQPMITADRYLSFVIRLLVAFGLIFELPVVVLILSVLGLVTPKFLRSKRRHAIVIITVLASLLSPGDLIMVTVIMMVPLIFLYELSILLSVLVYRKKGEKLEPATEPPPGAVERE
jgi:sec-independent protein translocase protein TatC